MKTYLNEVERFGFCVECLEEWICYKLFENKSNVQNFKKSISKRGGLSWGFKYKELRTYLNGVEWFEFWVERWEVRIDLMYKVSTKVN